MDLIADMLMEALPSAGGSAIAPTLLRPPMAQRLSRLPLVGRGSRAHLGDRLTGRLWDYPRWLAPRSGEFDVFHVVDHSYAHLLRVLPADRTIVTCNDVDAIQAALPGAAGRLAPSRMLASRILEGLASAAHIACISHATRTALLENGRIEPERVSVVYLGVHPSCLPGPVPRWDSEIDGRLGPRRIEILHVGSTIPRKQIDALLKIFRGVRDACGDVRLIRVGGALSPAQRVSAEALGVASAIVELPFLERPLLAALYRRASILVLPSSREGFGLPVVEAMACGTPVVASAIPALEEVGGAVASLCAPGDIAQWVRVIAELLAEQRQNPAAWDARKRASITAAGRFDWRVYAARMASLYRDVSARALARSPSMPQAGIRSS
jgi:glycosyltransferase involved in cell wall biosynthesis